MLKAEIMAKHGLSETKFDQMSKGVLNCNFDEVLEFPSGSAVRDIANLVMTSGTVEPDITITISGAAAIGKTILARQLQLILTSMGHNTRNDDDGSGVSREMPSFGDFPTPLHKKLILIETKIS